jgi:hypothetical protein
MMAQGVDTSVIAKIQKLLSLANSPIEAEASLAMARAQELLAKYNLEFEMVRDAQVAGGTVPIEEKREKTRIARSAKYIWQQELYRAIAESNFCWYWISEVFEGKRGKGVDSKVPVKRHSVLGRESNVIATRIMGEYLEDTIERLLPYPNSERMSRSANSWKRGCAERIVTRIRAEMEARQAREAAPGASNALVIRDVYAREYEANYDARHGQGAYARKQIEDEKWEKERVQRREQREREWLEYLQNETPEQKKERERKEAKAARRQEAANRRYSRSYANERYREASKVDGEAYRAGKVVGNSISLSKQAGESTKRAPKRLR